MYLNGASSAETLDDGNAIESDEYYTASSSEVRVITFDLDNCLWKTGATISAANDALAVFLEENNIAQPVRVEKVMGQLFKESPETYSPDGCKAPVLLTLLRKHAIQQVLQEHNDYSEEDAEKLANEAFDVWTKARHDEIPYHFASSVVSSLQKIRDMPTSSGQPILIGAVTDGNSDPRNVDVLSEFFDFCVNAESVGVSKPHRKMYLEAMSKVTEHPHVQDIFGPIQSTLTEEIVEDIMGPWWVHVGDDFIKDVVPAKELKMRSIWARELILSKLQQAEDNNVKNKVDKPKKTVEELVKQLADKKVIEMSVGADDYLVDSIRSEFADAVVDSFDEISNVLSEWQHNALRRAEGERTNGETREVQAEMVTVVEVASAAPPEEQEETPNASPETKFCVYCGTKLPLPAKFCSSCGEKQPEIST